MCVLKFRLLTVVCAPLTVYFTVNGVERTVDGVEITVDGVEITVDGCSTYR